LQPIINNQLFKTGVCLTTQINLYFLTLILQIHDYIGFVISKSTLSQTFLSEDELVAFFTQSSLVLYYSNLPFISISFVVTYTPSGCREDVKNLCEILHRLIFVEISSQHWNYHAPPDRLAPNHSATARSLQRRQIDSHPTIVLMLQ